MRSDESDSRFDLDLLDEDDPFEIDDQLAHLFKHNGVDPADLYELWESAPAFYPAKPPAHWMMLGIIDGKPVLAPLAPARDGRTDKCRPIGMYQGTRHDEEFYRAFIRGTE